LPRTAIRANVRVVFSYPRHSPDPDPAAGDCAPLQDHTHRDHTAHGVAARGRGSAMLNPGNRFEDVRLHILGEYRDEQLREHPSGVQVKTIAYRDETRTIINKVSDSPDIGFDWTINPYRGCEHGCIYCYARPGHEYLGMSCGLDFESRIMVKTSAPDLLRRELASPKWRGEVIVMCGVTDCYQPLEKKLLITRGCLEVMAECCQPVSIVTKNHLITRDIDVLRKLAQHNCVSVGISVTTLDRELAMKMEPRASTPHDRLRAMRELTDAGIPVIAMTAPIIPGLNDRELPALLKAAAENGAISASWVMLRLPWQIKDLFLEWLQRHYPDRARKVESFIRQMRGGELYDARFGTRMRGEGEHAELIKRMFKTYRKRYGLDRAMPKLSSSAFRRPILDGQLELFK
jgi:DNA repair photolyase